MIPVSKLIHTVKPVKLPDGSLLPVHTYGTVLTHGEGGQHFVLFGHGDNVREVWVDANAIAQPRPVNEADWGSDPMGTWHGRERMTRPPRPKKVKRTPDGLRIWKTSERLPVEADVNNSGFVFARQAGRLGFDGVRWREVNTARHWEWHSAPKA